MEQWLIVYVIRLVAVKAACGTFILIEETLIVCVFHTARSYNVRLSERNLFTDIAVTVTGELAPFPEAGFTSLQTVIFEEKLRS